MKAQNEQIEQNMEHINNFLKNNFLKLKTIQQDLFKLDSFFI